jgi:hypothetical protein
LAILLKVESEKEGKKKDIIEFEVGISQLLDT